MEFCHRGKMGTLIFIFRDSLIFEGSVSCLGGGFSFRREFQL